MRWESVIGWAQLGVIGWRQLGVMGQFDRIRTAW